MGDERHTRIRGRQFKDDDLLPEDIATTNSPTNGQVASYDSASGKFKWISTVAGAQDLAITIYGDAFVTAGIADFMAGANLDGKTLSYISIKVDTAPTGATLIIDVHKNGTTIFTTQANRPQITSGNTSGSDATPDVQSVAKGDIFQINVDQIGSTIVGGNNLYLTFHFI